MYSQDNDVEVHHDWTEARGLAQLEEYERDALPGNIMSWFIWFDVNQPVGEEKKMYADRQCRFSTCMF